MNIIYYTFEFVQFIIRGEYCKGAKIRFCGFAVDDLSDVSKYLAAGSRLTFATLDDRDVTHVNLN